MSQLITERELAAFRRDQLSPHALLELAERHVALLVRVAVGVGKSRAIDDLLQCESTYDRFDFVFCAAPTWNILNERRVVRGQDQAPVPHLVIEPRPAKRCGERHALWSDLERRGCAALAKHTLCGPCPHSTAAVDPCQWPKRFSRAREVRLVFATDAQLRLNPSLIPFLLMITGAHRPLIILDEGQLLDSRFEVELSFEDLDQFEWACREVTAPKGLDPSIFERLKACLNAARRGRLQALPDDAPDVFRSVNRRAQLVQKYGVERFEEEFRYIGYDLEQLARSAAQERWRDERGIRFTARPYLRRHLMLFSAHLNPLYVAHRLGVTAIHSPFQDFRFQHSGTRIINLRSRTGAAAYFRRNYRPILDSFAVALAENIARGKTTVLVARKKSKGFCADYLQRRLAGWGVRAEFVLDTSGGLGDPSPSIVPVIHYGVLGVNDYEQYDALYCLNSYYVSSRVLTRTVMEFDPDLVRVELGIVSGPDRHRRVRASSARHNRATIESLGNEYLHRLELDPVIQVAGRVRFATHAREIVLFHMAPLADALPGCIDVATPSAMRAALGLPDPAQCDRELQAEAARALITQGMTAAAAAESLGVSRRTLFRRMSRPESAKPPIEISSYRRFGTPTPQPPSSDGGGQ